MKTLSAEAYAAKLVAKMSLEEKASQMCHEAPAIPRLGIPAYNWWNEALHGVARAGYATVFPQPIARAATFDEKLERGIGDAISTEGRAKYNLFQKKGIREIYDGLTFWSPNVNLFRDPRWGRGHETFGEDPILSARMGTAFVKGVQGTDPKHPKAAACAKHFAVHSGPEAERHGFDARVSGRALREYYLPAFESLVKEGRTEAVMSAYSGVNGEPCSASPTLLTKILREEWGFQGHVVSDCGAIDDILTGHKTVGTPKEAAAAAVTAGCDLCCSRFYVHLVEAVRKGLIPESELDVHLIRLFSLRVRLGILGPKARSDWDSLGAESIHTPAHRALALRCAEESLVLVKNDGILPFDRKTLRGLGVGGPLAFNGRALLGNYNGLSPDLTTCLEGIVRAAGPDVRIAQDRLARLLDDGPVPEWNLGPFMEQADQHPETYPIVLCMGIVPYLEGEEGETIPPYNGDRTGLSIPDVQMKYAKQLHDLGYPLVCVVFGGSPQDLARLEEIASAVLVAWYPGEAGGEAIGRVLFGDVNPSGRLPVTFPKSLADLPPFRDYDLPGHTYRYSAAEPLHPFGFGLSYTAFAYSKASVKWVGKAPVATVTVKNTGRRPGTEVVQAYVRAPEGQGPAPRHALAGFARVSLRPGQSKTVSVRLDPRIFRLYRDDGTAFIPDAPFTVFLGGGQPGFAKTVAAKTKAPPNVRPGSHS